MNREIKQLVYLCWRMLNNGIPNNAMEEEIEFALNINFPNEKRGKRRVNGIRMRKKSSQTIENLCNCIR